VTDGPFFLVDAVPAAGEFRLSGPEGRHAAAVRRLRVGETLVLTDGRGRRAAGTVREVGRGELTLQVSAAQTIDRPAVRVTLVQALPKGDRGELAVELATEAGVDEIVPWAASRCVARWTADRADRGRARWQNAAREAAKQSRRSYVPVVHQVASTAAVLARILQAAGTVLLHEMAESPLTAVPLPAEGELLLVVGPEGGVADDEVRGFREAGAAPVRLGPEVLRTSTAGAVALGALGVLTGRWGDPDRSRR
jgi:16S rRNA (uracil1498-N3)-methyltransferase